MQIRKKDGISTESIDHARRSGKHIEVSGMKLAANRQVVPTKLRADGSASGWLRKATEVVSAARRE